MMKVRLEHAVISFCPDLTDPDAKSIPLALIGVGHIAASEGVLFLAVRPDLGGIARDQLSRAILTGLPNFLENQIELGMNDVGPTKLLSWLHNNLRNTLHVAHVIRAKADITVTAPEETITRFIRLFRKEVATEKKRLPERRTKEISKPLIPEIVFHRLQQRREQRALQAVI